MKRLIILFSAISSLFIFTSCSDNRVFDETSGERITQLLTQTENILNDAPNGWVMEFYYGKGLEYGGLYLYMAFNEGNVDISSEEGGANYIESSTYSYNQDQSATINFDTYNSLLHCYSEPSSGNTVGMLGDYEFVIIESTPEKITLRGKRNGVMYYMYPMASNITWSEKIKEHAQITIEMERLVTYTLIVDDKSYELTRESYGSTRRRKFTCTDNDGEVTEMPFIYTFEGLKFYEPVAFNGITFQELYWDGRSKLSDDMYGITIE